MLSRILGDVNGEGCRLRFARTRGVHKFKGKGVSKLIGEVNIRWRDKEVS